MFSFLWPSKPPKSKPPETTQENPPEPLLGEIREIKNLELERFRSRIESLPLSLVVLVAFGLGVACSAAGASLYIRYGRRIKNSDWITPDLFEKKRWIRGVVTSVGDPDNFRFFHTPSFGGWRWPLKFRSVPKSIKELRNQTLHIRIAGVDAPEAGHFGKPPQPHAEESLQWLQKKILRKVVYCQLIHRDHYQRVVAHVHLAPRIFPGAFFFGRNLSLEMLRAGCAMTYGQAGAEYGREGKEEYLRIEAEARAARRGMWAKGMVQETPAEYKRRFSSASQEPQEPEPVKEGTTRRKAALQAPTGWFSRLF